ncbi:MAG: 50S ribosomal protein L24 [Thermoplasmata archaeon]|nr:MAG: 50S ribosomal protein L24 [Thermoplasmata archaeon]RLF60004.1 MAG: 50S ribosomal protein L24 [Thermoplasmata archaeon]HDI23880.1 50S ribosomal protein L24 [Thermoplasmatales archaeon]
MIESRQPRKQRKFLFNAPLHIRRKFLSAHLSDDLITKYKRRSFPIAKGDTVKVVRGDFKGHTGKVAEVDLKRGIVKVEGVLITKADGKRVMRPLHPSNLIITKLNLTDPIRRKKLERGVSEEVRKEIEKEAEEQIKEMEKQEEEIKEEKEEESGEKEVKEDEQTS